MQSFGRNSPHIYQTLLTDPKIIDGQNVLFYGMKKEMTGMTLLNYLMNQKTLKIGWRR